MRIVLDLQGAQADNRLRGIGRYSLSLAQAIVRNRGEHEVLIVLSGLFPSTVEAIRKAFDGLLPRENFRVWESLAPVNQLDAANDVRRETAEYSREAFLAALNPDIVHITSLFEGLGDDAVTSIGKFYCGVLTSVTLYDLIPHIYPCPYLDNPVISRWYENKLASLRRSDLLLAISESSRQEGCAYLGFDSDAVVNVSTAAEGHFRPIDVEKKDEQAVRERYGLARPFVMYTGGIDHRKNIEGLIRAYARLPEAVRTTHQLAVVCSVQAESRQSLERLADHEGLMPEELILTGYVPEEDLLTLYNLCKLFVFPSWHEGFGLPALEAMSCGAAVIGANTSSLPEVIGREDALFDPRLDSAISSKMLEVLTDDSFRDGLRKHGPEQAKKFSWDTTGKRAVAAFERLYEKRALAQKTTGEIRNRPKLAYVSPLPPERSGISDYSAELLPELAHYYDVTVVVAQEHVSDPWVIDHCAIHSPEWLVDHAKTFDRVLYHFGNSSFHQHMFALHEQVPGVIVLHDFFLSGIQAHRDVHMGNKNAWVQELYHAHGYQAVKERFHVKDTAEVVWRYPTNLSVLQQALGVIVHANNSLRLASHWYGPGFPDDWAVIPLLRVAASLGERAMARRKLGLESDDFVVCSFGLLGPSKLNHRLVDAWLNSPLAKELRAILIFVGENNNGEYGTLLEKKICLEGNSRIRITGWEDTDGFRRYLAAADVAVQLRTLSRGETSAAVLDCMNYSVPTIINANGSMADVPNDAVWMLPDEFSDEQLITALETLWRDSDLRKDLGRRARNLILSQHDPKSCAKKYFEAIETCYARSRNGLSALKVAVATHENINLMPDRELMDLANCIALNHPVKSASKKLFIDVSELVQRDAKSGIQRVTRSILKELLENPPDGYKVEPVYATTERAYCYARNFTLRFLDCPQDVLTDEPLEFAVGDIFLGLDLQPHVVAAHDNSYQKMRLHGVKVCFVVYDLLCVLMPQFFVEGASEGFTRWLKVVAKSDVAICISQAVAKELTEFIQKNEPERYHSCRIKWFHLGADVENSVPTQGVPSEAVHVLKELSARMSFLTVGTIEPRKGHAQILSAFELLWQQGLQINLVMVGKQGWMVEALIERISNHPELNKRLYWLDGISDAYLEQVYAASSCLVAASHGEGFGLPLIEAAQHRLPMIIRDIPVFREVAGPHSFYFKGEGPSDLADALIQWVELKVAGVNPCSERLQWSTWQESTQSLLSKLLV